MPSTTCRLPNGQTFSVTPVFGGFTFKSNDMNIHNSAFPPGWTIIIETEKEPAECSKTPDHGDNRPQTETSARESHEGQGQDPEAGDEEEKGKEVHTVRFTRPTMCNDSMFISSIVSPSERDFKPPSSPTRQIAMMLWASLYWYFHEPEPDLHLKTEACAKTPISGRPKGDWRIKIKRDGIFKGRNLLQKLERMGLIASEDSSVGFTLGESQDPAGWSNMFVSRKAFWQIDPRIFLFTLSPAAGAGAGDNLPSSRPSSPNRDLWAMRVMDGTPFSPSEALYYNASGGPFTSGSHLPTYFPPAVTQYTFTNGIRHPIRQKPPRQGEIFYSRYIPSVGQYLSFRVPLLDLPKAPERHEQAVSATGPTTNIPPDLETLHRWMNDPRVNAAWGEAGPISHQEKFLRAGLSDRHSFPVIGCWDGKPFGYFEIYWVKEDRLGQLLGGNVDDYDRGLHVLVGEQEFRGPHRVAIWLSALVHYCWLADMRTRTVMLEPRVDNEKYVFSPPPPFFFLFPCFFSLPFFLLYNVCTDKENSDSSTTSSKPDSTRKAR